MRHFLYNSKLKIIGGINMLNMHRFIVVILRFAVRWSIPAELKNLKNSTADEVARALAVRYQFGSAFESLLSRTLTLDLPPGLRETFQANLEEEQGLSQSYPGAKHSIGRLRLLNALGIDSEVWQSEIHPAMVKVIQVFDGLIALVNPLFVAAGLAAFESLVAPQYTCLLEALMRTHPYLTDADTEHLRDHIHHDVFHGNDALAALAAAITTPYDLIVALVAITEAKRTWTRFWQEVVRT